MSSENSSLKTNKPCPRPAGHIGMSDTAPLPQRAALGGDKRAEYWMGVKAMLPFLLTAVPMGMIGGAYGVSSGLTPLETMALAMSANSGTVQFVGIRLLQENAGWAVILLTSLILSLRLVFYSTMLRSPMRDVTPAWRVLLAFGLIDAVFFVVNERLSKTKKHPPMWHWYYFGASSVMYVSWMAATFVGMKIGAYLPDFLKYGIDFPMTAIFAAMLASTLSNWKVVVAVACAAIIALMAHALPYSVGLVIAALSAALIGYCCEKMEKKFSSNVKRS